MWTCNWPLDPTKARGLTNHCGRRRPATRRVGAADLEHQVEGHVSDIGCDNPGLRPLVVDIGVLLIARRIHGRVAKAARYLASASLVCLALAVGAGVYLLAVWHPFAGLPPSGRIMEHVMTAFGLGYFALSAAAIPTILVCIRKARS